MGPFSRTVLLSFSDLSEKSIRAELAAQDASSLQRSWAARSKNNVTMNQVIAMGLDLEEEQ